MIPPHNLGEVVDATVAQMNSTITLDELLTYIKGPDFPTGAEVYGGAQSGVKHISGASIEERKNGRYSIIITEFHTV